MFQASLTQVASSFPPVLGWVVFGAAIGTVLILDLFVFHRHAHTIGIRESLTWSAVWISLALLFGVGVYVVRGPVSGLEFFTAYLIEETLSIDNLFVFLLLFRHFRVPPQYQHRVLLWGILGALVMRLAFILAGISLLRAFHWIVYIFGTVLVVSGIRMAAQQETQIDPEKSVVLRAFRRFFPVTPEYEGGRFFVRRAGRIMATPLFVVLLMVETTDLVFAIDSIPAVLAISRDTFIVYTSNVFAILGLRMIFFALAGLIRIFHHLHYGLSAILVFVGIKMILSDVFHVPVAVALIVVGVTLAASVVASIVWPKAAELPSTPGEAGPSASPPLREARGAASGAPESPED